MGTSLTVLLGLAALLTIAAAVVILVLTRRSQQPQVAAPPLQGRPRTVLAKLIAHEGPLTGREFTIPPPPRGLTIGRDPVNDVVLSDDILVSRRHAQIVLENGQFVLHDRNSVNGLFVNNQRVARRVLENDDLIQVCNSCFRFVTGTEPSLSVSRPPQEKKESAREIAPVDSLRLSTQTYFEGYLLERELGRGGMSVVYKACDARDAPVAIKILDVTDEYLMRKFVQEGKIGAALRDHPNIRIVHDLRRSQDNRLFLVMQYIEGQSLRQVINQRWSDGEIIRIIGQVCDALHYAHQQHIVHRDIKPENILIDNQGVVKVTDFGIAKLTSSVTVTSDRIVGTPEYLSPEQAQGQQRILPASDIYSLGIVLYEMLVGGPPFPLPRNLPPREATLSILTKHIRTKPTPPSRIQPQVSKRLEQIALKALKKNPKNRFPTALAMGQELGYQRQAIPPAPSPKVAHLIIVRGSHVGQRIRCGSEVTIIGREHIAPDDPQVSRKHLSITPRGDQLWLEDMSLNGTWVNGRRIYGEIPIDASDEIAVGSHMLRVEM